MHALKDVGRNINSKNQNIVKKNRPSGSISCVVFTIEIRHAGFWPDRVLEAETKPRIWRVARVIDKRIRVRWDGTCIQCSLLTLLIDFFGLQPPVS